MLRLEVAEQQLKNAILERDQFSRDLAKMKLQNAELQKVHSETLQNAADAEGNVLASLSKSQMGLTLANEEKVPLIRDKEKAQNQLKELQDHLEKQLEELQDHLRDTESALNDAQSQVFLKFDFAMYACACTKVVLREYEPFIFVCAFFTRVIHTDLFYRSGNTISQRQLSKLHKPDWPWWRSSLKRQRQS